MPSFPLYAEIMLRQDGAVDKCIGVIGVVHPEVLSNYDITYPCSLLELDVEAIM